MLSRIQHTSVVCVFSKMIILNCSVPTQCKILLNTVSNCCSKLHHGLSVACSRVSQLQLMSRHTCPTAESSEK